MAHGNYDCCAICDGKMSYVGLGADTKEAICSGCIQSLMDRGINTATPERFLQWADSVDVDTLRVTLAALGYESCVYGNDFDTSIRKMLSEQEATTDA